MFQKLFAYILKQLDLCSIRVKGLTIYPLALIFYYDKSYAKFSQVLLKDYPSLIHTPGIAENKEFFVDNIFATVLRRFNFIKHVKILYELTRN